MGRATACSDFQVFFQRLLLFDICGIMRGRMNEMLLLLGPLALLLAQAAAIVSICVYAVGYMGGGSARAGQWLGAVWSWIFKMIRKAGKAILKVFLKILGAISLKVSQGCEACVRRL
jgi:hypothetical protein